MHLYKVNMGVLILESTRGRFCFFFFSSEGKTVYVCGGAVYVWLCVCVCMCVFTQKFIIENFLLQGHGSVPKIQPSVLLHFLQTMAKAIETLAFRLFGCHFIWRAGWSDPENPLSQWLHLKDFAPVCFLYCLVSSSLRAKCHSHTSHEHLGAFRAMT